MRISEALQILKILYNMPQTTCGYIAGEVGISLRSVYRYIEEFIVCGIPVEVKRGRRGGGVWLPSEYKKELNTLGGLIRAYAG